MSPKATDKDKPCRHDASSLLDLFPSTLRPLAWSVTLGSALLGLGGCSEKAESIDIDGTQLTVKDRSTFPVIEPAEALQGIKEERFKKAVIELENAATGQYTYGFQTPTGELYLVRGLHAGPERNQFIHALKEHQVPLMGSYLNTSNDSGSSFWSWIAVLGINGATIGLLYYLRAQKSSGSSKQEQGVDQDRRPRERFQDVGGNYELVAEMRELARDVEAWSKGDDAIQLPRGILMAGDPGLGKTFMARVCAGEMNCLFFSVNTGSLLSSSYMGAWTRQIFALFGQFQEARDAETARLRALPGATGKERAVVIAFFDEFDSLGKAREQGPHAGVVEEERVRAVNAFLAEMDGVNQTKNSGIIIMAATNSPKSLDDALLRPGRFTKQFTLFPPRNAQERMEVLQKVAAGIFDGTGSRLEDPTLLEYIARISGGESPDHLKGIISRAVELARRDGRALVTGADLFEGYQRQKFGAVSGQKTSPKKLELVAYHEHGHGLAAIACGMNVMVVSMKPRGQTAGRVIVDSDPLTEPPLTREELLRALVLNAGGRAGEVSAFGQTGSSDGAMQDLHNMREICKLILSNGMLDDRFALDRGDMSNGALPADYMLLIDRLCENAVATAEEIIDAAGPETFKRLVLDSLAADRELVGDEAGAFYRRHADGGRLDAMRAAAQAFIDKPLGEEERELRKPGLP